MITLRPPEPAELPAISALCLRSKAYWGYDASFMAACVDELTLSVEELGSSEIVVALDDQTIMGMAQIVISGGEADLQKLFVDPDHMGKGAGRLLMAWTVTAARDGGAETLLIEADPYAEAFYERHGAKRVGEIASGSISGRVLPLMRLDL